MSSEPLTVPSFSRGTARFPASGPWLLLMGLTVLSLWLGDGHGPGRMATIAVLVFAFFKVAIVGDYFMELRHAPLPLRLIFHAWSVVVCAALVVLYLDT